jgi:hypothetical protein
MAEYITLVGAEDVSRAASRMQSAAEEMSRAAMNIQAALEGHQRFLDDFISRFDATLTDRISDLGQSMR